MVARIVTLIAALVVAVIGAGLVILYALQADERAEARFTDVEVVVANRPIPAGTRLRDIAQTTADDTTFLTVRPVPEAAVVPGAWQDQIPGDERLDQVFVVAVQPGEQLLDAKLGAAQSATDRLRLAPAPPVEGQEPDPGRSAIVLSLPDSQRGSSWLQPGALVAVVLDEPETADRPGRSCVILPEMRVIAVGSRTELDDAGLPAEVGGPGAAAATPAPEIPTTFIALEVDQPKALTLTRAQARGSLSFILRPQDGGPPFSVGCLTDGEFANRVG